MNSPGKPNRTLVYCRESRDEGGEHYERIEVQRDILLQFCESQGLDNIVAVIMDDNVSGTSFKRLEQVALMARSGEIDTLVFKDASRLGRNLRESLNFLHRMEELGVTVLFESERYDPELFPLLAWFHEQRAREDSHKVRRVLHHKMQTGELLIHAPYGYRKENGGLVPDPLQAQAVGEAFRLFLSGLSTGEIAAALQQRGFPSPAPKAAKPWNRQHVYRMLSNRVYIGELELRKTVKSSFKSKKVTRLPSREWIVHPGHHPAIVAPEVFERAQAMRRRRPRRPARQPTRYAGLLRCGRCGGQMVQRLRAGRRPCYVCPAYHQKGTAACRSHRVTLQELDEWIGTFLRELVGQCSGLAEDILATLRQGSIERGELLRSQQQYRKILERVYSDRLHTPELVPEGFYDEKLREYSEKLRQTELLLKQCELPEHTASELPRWLAGLTPEQLSGGGLAGLIEHGTVYLPEEAPPELQKTLCPEQFQRLQRCGGVVFYLRE